MPKGLLSTKDVAARLHRSEQWVRNAARDGDLPAVLEPLRGGRTRYRFTTESVDDYLARHLAESPGLESARDRTIDRPARRDGADIGATDSIWLDHYREELARYRLQVADLQRTIDDLIAKGDEQEDEIRRLCGVVRRLLPDSAIS